MDKIYFLLGEMTHLRYFVPIVEELNTRNTQACFLIYFSDKYNCPSKHKNELNNICKQHGIEKKTASEFQEKNKTILCVESSCAKAVEQLGIKKRNSFYVLTSQFDFIQNYDFYAKYAKRVIFPSRWFLNHCRLFIGDERIRATSWSEEKINSPKNVFLGSPKYDIKLDREKIINKYNLSNKRKVLFLFPAVSQQSGMWTTKEKRGLSEGQINDIYGIIRSLGFEVLVKSRTKHPITKNCRGDRDFYDESWFPHTTMELMEVSDLAIMVDSTSIKECVLQKIPFINIGLINEKVRINAKNMTEPLLKYNYCQNYNNPPDINELKDKIKHLTTNQFYEEFNEAKKTYLFEPNESSKKIVDFIKTQEQYKGDI